MLSLAGKRNTLLDEKQVWNECLEPNYETMTASHKTQARKKKASLLSTKENDKSGCFGGKIVCCLCYKDSLELGGAPEQSH